MQVIRGEDCGLEGFLGYMEDDFAMFYILSIESSLNLDIRMEVGLF